MATFPGPPPPSPQLTSGAQFGAAALTARRQLGWTQEQLARRARVGLRFIYDLENGKRTVRLDKVLAVFRALSIVLMAFPGGDGSPGPR